MRTLWIGVMAMALAACARKAPETRPEARPANEPTPPTQAAQAPAPAAPVEVVLDTSLGEIVLELHPDKAPKTVENFLKLARQGFYDGILFHRVVPGFVIQGGDPKTKDPALRAEWGTGDPGYRFPDEPVKGEYTRGALAMANSGPDTNGSQFFICLQDLSGRLPKKYNWFGQVKAGMEVVDRIAALPRDQRDCPTEPAVIRKATVRE
ncbi:MAG TPA: peptidylprolyl isomerase [Myxococcota bacterium]|nr:peptidylprolyl isomerase [Myxococcota bacterium]HQK51093.1 peptidylprolyl isomerase [Myxococcota bacterium]